MKIHANDGCCDGGARDVGFLAPLSADVLDGATTARFSFAGFDPGESRGIRLDTDLGAADGSAPGEDGDTVPGGRQLSGTTLEITFRGAGGGTARLSFVNSPAGGTGKKSCPTDPVPVADAPLALPEPGPAWMLLVGLCGAGRRRPLPRSPPREL